MHRNRILIRLIDVALIVLMSFIAVSRMKTEYVDLPSVGEGTPRAMNKTAEASLHVFRDHFVVYDKGRKERVKNLSDLETRLLKKKEKYAKNHTRLVVNIKPRKPSIMQNLVDVIDICQLHAIDKSLSYESIN